MKVKGFPALVLSDLYILKKKLTLTVVLTFGFMLVALLLVLSLNYGNLGRLPELVGFEGEQAQQTHEIISTGIFSFSYLLASIFCGETILLTVDLSAADEKTKGQRFFLKASPATPFKRALARTASNIILLTVSFLLLLIWQLVFFLAAGQTESKATSAAVVLLMLIVFMSVIGQFFVSLFRSMDKGMLAAIGVIMAVSFAAARIIGADSANSSEDDFAIITAAAESIAPLVPLFTAVIFIVFVPTMTFIFGRREK